MSKYDTIHEHLLAAALAADDLGWTAQGDERIDLRILASQIAGSLELSRRLAQSRKAQGGRKVLDLAGRLELHKN